jgi:subtilisin-like proprotein convertase family protein
MALSNRDTSMSSHFLFSRRPVMRRSGLASLALAAALGAGLPSLQRASAQILVDSVSSTPNLVIPDGSTAGVSVTIDLPSAIVSITYVSVELKISGGFTGDYYAYLQHDTGLAVLLNRTGRSGNSGEGALGYLDGGFDVTLEESADQGDIHFYQAASNPGGGILTGTWQPDGRNTNPFIVDGSESRNATFSQFTGLAAAGEWTLFVADLSSGGVGVLDSWSLTVTGAIPEPGEVAGLTAAALVLVAGVRALRRRAAAS